MEPRGCRDFFITTIKNGSVTKVSNVDSCGNPALKFKTLKDVYECEDAKRISSCLPEVDRTSYKEDFGSSHILNHVNDQDDSNVTLSQLKTFSRRKKRKFSSVSHLNDANEVYDKLQIGEDDLDLMEPLINWKMKLSKETPKVKRKRSSGGAVKSELALSVKLEPVHGFETGMFANRDLSVVCVKREDPEPDSFEIESPISDNHDCVLNEVCYNHLDPIPSVEVSDETVGFSPCDVSPTAESDTDDKSDNMLSAPLNVLLVNTAVNNEIVLTDSPPLVTQTESFSLQESASFLDSHACSSPEDESVSTIDGITEMDQSQASCSSPEDESIPTNDGITEIDQSQACSSTDTSQNSCSPRNGIPSDLPTTNGKQPPEMVSKDSKCLSSSNDTLSAPVVQNSGRLTRKIIPPTSQERLSLSLNCEELHNDADEYKCKEKLFFPEENKSNPLIVRSNIGTARRDENIARPGQLNQRKVFIKRSQIRHKVKNGKRGLPPKNTLEQPCYPRSFPCINTGCTSVKNCSKGAIAFSQQQMQSIDSLAGNLLNELKSMKEIVEQKLLLNSSRNLTLRNDADEVVAAIKTATRAEENAKRLLSVMARDSNRFCTIMSLTEDGPSTSENEIPRKRRKIVFADEAGKTLCDVKLFENGSPSVQELDNQNENA